MLKRLPLAVVLAGLLAASIPPATAADAVADRGGAKRGVTLKPSAQQAEEGDRLTLTAKVKGAAAAKRVTLQHQTTSVFGDAEWVDVKSKRVKGKARVRFGVVATEENRERYRATVSYEDGKKVTSKPVAVTMWRWIALSSYASYYEAGGGYFANVDINGQTYAGYYNYGNGPTWEERFTSGRNCKAFRAVLGLQDNSDDGSSGVVKLTADGSVVYQSPALTPGMDIRVVRSLSLPYRFGFQLLNTAPEGLVARPTMGEPALLCTGVG